MVKECQENRNKMLKNLQEDKDQLWKLDQLNQELHDKNELDKKIENVR